MGRILKNDPVTKIRKTIYADDYTGDGVVHTEQDVSLLVEANKAHYAYFDGKARHAKDGEMVASIPLTVYWALPKHVREDDDELSKWLDDPDQRAFRTHPSKLYKRTSLR